MKKTTWDPYSGAPPPPPPPLRVNPNNKPALAPLPPPPSRTGSSVGSGSTSSVSRAPSIASSAAPPLPGRSFSAAPPPLPRRTNTLSPPPLPGRSGSASPVSFSSVAPSPPAPPPPPPRSPIPPLSRTSSTAQDTPPPPPLINSATKPGVSLAPAFPAPAPSARAPPPKRSPVIPPQPKSPHLEEIHSVKDDIDWANLSEEDKQVFFSWLDEFFTRLLGVPVGPGQGVAHGLPSAGPPPALRLGVSNATVPL